MWTTASIGRFITQLPEGRLFTTRDCLIFGRRAAVDQALARLVKRGRIRRLARGVFVKDYCERLTFSDHDIAVVKAESFGRQIAAHPYALAQKLGLHTQPNELTYSISGRTTKFHIDNRLVHFMQAAPRKLRIADGIPGETWRALWQLSSSGVDRETISCAFSKFDRLERADRLRHLPWLPAWLSDYCQPPKQIKPLAA